MCIAIYKPINKHISKKALLRCYEANPDGAGFMYAEDKELYTHKGFFTFDEFYKAYKPHEKKQTLIHFRIKTHGKVDKENCHPFLINKGLGFIHNGIITGYGDDIKSDTIKFNEAILKPLVAKWGNLALFTNPVQELIETTIGYSKLVFLDRHGNHHIMNEDNGAWDKGIWYSNTSYKPKPKMIPMVGHNNQYRLDYKNWYNNYDDFKTASHTPQLTPVRQAGSVQPSIIAIGDLVQLTENLTDEGTKEQFVKGDWLEVVKINSDYTFDLITDYPSSKGQGFLYNVNRDSIESYDYSDNTLDSNNDLIVTTKKGSKAWWKR
jgi:glutamine amidotransferase